MLPHVDTICLDVFLETLRAEWPQERIGVVLDGSGSHRSETVHWPEGIVPVRLPPYSPELNPAEQIFRHLRRRLANRIFATIAEMQDALVAEMQRLWAHPTVVTRMTNYPWWREGVVAFTSPLP